MMSSQCYSGVNGCEALLSSGVSRDHRLGKLQTVLYMGSNFSISSEDFASEVR